MRIAVSAGHHPAAPGASLGDFVEHTEALAWQREIAAHLEGAAVLVPAGKLSTKVAWINSRDDIAAAVEIHFNAAKNSHGVYVGDGCETLYNPGSVKGLKLAGQVQDALAKVMPPSRGSKEGWYQMRVGGSRLHFLNKTKMPAIVIEPEFIHHAELIRSKRAIACKAIAEVLAGWVGLSLSAPQPQSVTTPNPPSFSQEAQTLREIANRLESPA